MGVAVIRNSSEVPGALIPDDFAKCGQGCAPHACGCFDAFLLMRGGWTEHAASFPKRECLFSGVPAQEAQTLELG